MMSGIFISLLGLTLMMNKINLADIPWSSGMHTVLEQGFIMTLLTQVVLFITQNT